MFIYFSIIGCTFSGFFIHFHLIGCIFHEQTWQTKWIKWASTLESHVKIFNPYLKLAKLLVFNVSQIAVNHCLSQPSLQGKRGEMQQARAPDCSSVVYVYLMWEHWYWQGHILLLLKLLCCTDYLCFRDVFFHLENTKTFEERAQ